MKKTFKLTLIILLIILLSMISFVGIYRQNKTIFENVLPEYLLAKDLKGYRRIQLKPNDDVTETIKYDENGNVIASDDTATQVARTEDKTVNSDALNSENYKKVKEILEKRFNTMNVSDYSIRINEENGEVVLEIPEDKNTDRVVGQLSLQGKFEVVDKDTSEVLMTNDDLKFVKAGYGATASGTTAIFVNIQFDKEGTEKFKDITNKYIETTQLVEAENEGEEATEETVTKEVELKVDGSTLLTTHFDEEVSNGLLQLSLGSANSSNEELQEYLLEANSLASLLDAGKMPIVYNIEQNKFIYSDITLNDIKAIVIVSVILLALGVIYLVIRYKAKGILASISLIGYIAVLLIAIRYFNVEISISAICGILLSIALSYKLLSNILKEKELLKVITKYTIVFIPALVIAIVCTFMNIGIGATLFWGISIALLYHLSITNLMLKD